mmetsp:Transcript_10617/g.28376  ORF Transcript_10617/g.28376 Transcript_10617/m.28376 type:complete len:173 (+) Transcript_10617:374-892(+)
MQAQGESPMRAARQHAHAAPRHQGGLLQAPSDSDVALPAHGHQLKSFDTFTMSNITGISTKGPTIVATAWGELVPKIAVVAARANSKLLLAAVNASVATCPRGSPRTNLLNAQVSPNMRPKYKSKGTTTRPTSVIGNAPLSNEGLISANIHSTVHSKASKPTGAKRGKNFSS